MDYLSHKLKPHIFFGYEDAEDFKCDICGVCLAYCNYKYYLMDNDGFVQDYLNEFKLTCNEWIIKNILE